jgi:hypothetical protein
MTYIHARLAKPDDVDSIQRLLCGTPGQPGGPLRGTQPSAAGVSEMLGRMLLPVVTVDAAGEVRSIVSGYGLDLVGEDHVFLSICADHEVLGRPLAVIGVAAWLEAFRARFPLTRVLVEGPAPVFGSAGLSSVLVGPLVRRPGSWWTAERYEEYQLWALDVRAALRLAGRLQDAPAVPRLSRDVDFAGFAETFCDEMELDVGPDEPLRLDSLATTEAIAVIAEMAGAELAEDALCKGVGTLRKAFALYRELREQGLDPLAAPR